MAPVVAQGMDGDGMMGAPAVMVAAMVVLALLLVAGLVWLVRTLTRRRHDASTGAHGADADAEQVLARRYAEGEIDAEEYRRRRSVLAGRG